MSRNVLVTEKLLDDVFLLIHFLHDELLPDFIVSLSDSIESELLVKFKKMHIRKVFTAYKMAPPGPERENLRREYVRLAEFRSSFTSENEIPYSDL